ncbi:hypothetical protein [Microbacterium sp. G2-8]|uniref:hypothetical protein n=1 Tax=Microbacterium sp. G2-8 TaxID=2842454 RepID=UPI001C89DD00|nr:hypothetical protein [Microbacterium sp. G2-8]
MHPRSRAELLADGYTEHAVRGGVRSGRIERIRHGYYAERDGWDGAYVEERQRILARAAADAAHTPPVFCHVTAAALHRLPLSRHVDERAHVLAREGGSGTSTGSVQRHRDRWDGDAVDCGGLLVTTLARTVFDVARRARRETAMACADAAIRQIAARDDGRRLEAEADAAFRQEIRDLAARFTGARGVARARFVAEAMDPCAESPGESISGLYLRDIGFRTFDRQVEIQVPEGRRYFVDFAFAGILGEYDGATKYLNRAMRGGRSSEQVVFDEKRREDRIRAATGRRVLRWTTREIRTRDTFREFLSSHGVRP